MEVDEVIARLRAAIEKKGGVAIWATGALCSQSYVYDVLAGRTAPGPLVLSALGLEAVTTYREKA